MTPTVLISQKVVGEFGPRLAKIREFAPRKIEIIEFTPELVPTRAQLETIDAAFYSRDIWEGTVKDLLNRASQTFWSIVDEVPNIKWIQLVSAGADHRHYKPAMARGVRVTTSAGTNAEPVALTAVTGLMMLARGFPHWIRAQQRHEWSPHRGAIAPSDLRGQTAVIVGTGYIGTLIAQALKGFGVRTIGVRRRAAPAEHFDTVLPLAGLDFLLPTCDWLVLACPLTPETRGLMDMRRFALLPRHAGFINISRGAVVDEAALIDALANGRLKGAHLDVFAVEPLPAESPLWSLSNVIITPHDATASVGNYARGVELFLRNLEAYLHGGALENEVQP
jgi:phosphoglycerate dehydrogenase-like enzyme